MKNKVGSFLAKTIVFLLVFSLLVNIPVTGLVLNARADSASGELPADEGQAEQVAALGFSTQQPTRYSPSGQEVDRAASPIGVNTKTLYRVRQLAVGAGDTLRLYKNPNIIPDDPKQTMSYMKLNYQGIDKTTITSSSVYDRASVAADTDGNGKEEIVTAAMTSNRIKMIVTDYSTGKAVTKEYDAAGVTNPSDVTPKSVRIAAVDIDHDGKEEVAVCVANRLVIYKATITGCKIVGGETFDQDSKVYKYAENVTPELNVASGDLNQDGFKELFVVVGGNRGGSVRIWANVYKPEYALRLLIYDNTSVRSSGFFNSSAYCANIPMLATTRNILHEQFLCPSMDVGDIFGDGEKELVLGGRTSLNDILLTTVHYYPETNTYDTALSNTVYPFESAEYANITGPILGLKCASLQLPVAGDPQFVVLGGFLYRYNKETGAMDKQTVAEATNDSKIDGNKDNADKTMGNLTNFNYKKDSTEIFDILAGNFDETTLENLSGTSAEQIVMLHYNKWFDSEYYYITTISMDSDGIISERMHQLWKKGEGSIWPSICAPDIYNRGIQLEFEPEKSEFVFSDPTVVAVLGATPFYSELADQYEALGNAQTVFGTEKTKGSSSSNGITAGASVCFGFEDDITVPIIGTTIAKFEFETDIEESFTATFEKSKSVSKSVSYVNYCSDDAVVLTAIPYDFYYFISTNTLTGVSEEILMAVPYAPVTRIMSLTAYKAAATKMTGAPVISDKVLDHTVGDPRSYPSSKNEIVSNGGMDVTLGTNGDDYGNFVGVGTGNSTEEEGISLTTGSSTTFDNEFSVKFSFKKTFVTVFVGGSIEVGYNYSKTTSTEDTVLYSGSVASLPEGYDGYSFKWCLAAYNYSLTAGDSTQNCVVVTYLCQPTGKEYPPALPASFTVSTRSPGTVKLKWDAASGAAGYRVLRATSEDGEYTLLATLGRGTITQYTDTAASARTTYYYRLIAYNSRQAMPAALTAERLAVTDLTIKTQPKLTYTEKDQLDLSNLKLTVKYSDNTSEDIGFGSLDSDFKLSIANGSVLSADQTGKQVTVTYLPDWVTASTGSLSVCAVVSFDLSLSAVFTVGTKGNAAALEANKTVSASVTLKNNTASAQSVLVIMAMYSDKGAMVGSVITAVTVDASGSKTTSLSSSALKVPAGASGYSVKIFTWDGTSITSTSQKPMSNIVTLQ